MSPSTAPSRKARPPFRLRLRLARVALAWERAWIGLWPAATLVMAGLAVALTDVLPSLPSPVHLGVLIVFAAGVIALAVRGLRRFAWPTRAEARARLEAISPVTHRPLTAVEDSLANGATPLQRALWKRHQALARAALDRLRNPWPAPGVARRDGYALRTLAILLLAIAAIGSGRESGHRLHRAAVPAFGEGNAPVTVKLWITPPAYTGQSPIYLESPSAEAAPAKLDVPAGAKALVLVTGTHRDTKLVLTAPHEATKELPLAPLEATRSKSAADAQTSRRLELELPAVQRLEVRQGSRELAGWNVNWIADQPPTIAFAAPPRDVGRGRLRIDYTASDDYGVQSVTGRITRTGSNDAIDLNLSMPPFSPKQADHTSFHDLGGHAWAGMKVSLALTATDQAGQTATTAPVEIVLPERTFTNPVAQEIAHWRKELIAEPERTSVPAREAFTHLMEHPSAFNDDRVVYLALATAKYRLAYESATDALAGLPELLWQTAVRIEDGHLGAAEQRMEAAEKALQQAMEQNAPPEEVSRLVDELQRAFAEYTRALAEHMPGDKNSQMSSLDKQGNVINPNDIAGMLEQLRQLSRMGSKDAAKQMMANLQNMLQNYRNAAAGNQSENPDMKAAEQAMQDMRELTEQQSQLLNENFEQLRQQALKGEREGDQANGNKAAEKQQKLRQELGQLMGRMSGMTGQTPSSLNDANSAMRGAEQSLQAGSWRQGTQSQGEALSQLETGMQQASQQMMQALAKKGMSGVMQMPSGQRRSDGAGPRNGVDDGQQVRVPNGPDTEGMAQRVRSILDEIRRRASDRTRPEAEQEYLRRLMKEF